MKTYIIIRLILATLNHVGCKIQGHEPTTLNLILQFIGAPLSAFFGVLCLIYPYKAPAIMDFIDKHSKHLLIASGVFEALLIVLACLS